VNDASATFEQLISSLHRLSHVLGRESDALLQDSFDLGTAQFKIVWVLRKHPNGVPQKAIATWLSQTEAGISRQIQPMEQDGLLEVRVDPNNRRARIVCLTKKGKDFADKALKLMEQRQGDCFAKLTPAERSKLHGLLEKVFAQACKKHNW
jgi:DNA-binding MarR family transcriptional regulator